VSGQVDLIATGNRWPRSPKRSPARAPVLKFVIKDSPCYVGLNKNEPALLQGQRDHHQGEASGEIAKLSEKWLKAPLPPG
jgi:polar amino acid transport system substrate-binding protein